MLVSLRAALGLLTSGALLACGASSDGSSQPRSEGQHCDDERCDDEDGGAPSDDDADDAAEDMPLPCVAIARRDITQLNALQATPSGSPIAPAPPAPSSAPVPTAQANPGPVSPPDYCGDSRVTPPETCDDGNSIAGDGCDTSCTVEPDYACPSPGVPCIRVVICGDAIVDGTEACDDGNVTSGDGCDAQCRTETGYRCTPGQACTPVCGDAHLVGAEQCEDGNIANGDGCNARCRIEPGFVCPLMASAQMMPAGSAAPPIDEVGTSTPAQPVSLPCSPSECGNGTVENGEACDDGNTVSGDGCTSCILEPNCDADACETVCGDGIVVADASEECDDGNVSSFDGCDPQCHIEAGFVCTTAPNGDVPETAAPIAGDPLLQSECTSVCGDGIEVADEQCDDGSANGPGYGSCSAECQLGPRCGDAVVQAEDEQCDAGDGGNTGEYGNCAPGCVFGARCGDGVVQSDYEECDDGNAIRGDGCAVACRAEPLPDDAPSPDGPVLAPAPTNDVFVPDAPTLDEPTLDEPSERPEPNPCR